MPVARCVEVRRLSIQSTARAVVLLIKIHDRTGRTGERAAQRRERKDEGAVLKSRANRRFVEERISTVDNYFS